MRELCFLSCGEKNAVRDFECKGIVFRMTTETENKLPPFMARFTRETLKR